MIDWNKAIVRQCPKVGIESFQRNGMRNSFFPSCNIIISGTFPVCEKEGSHFIPKKINDGCPQGAIFGIPEHLSQFNNSADCVEQEDCFKYVDDLFMN